MTRIFSLPSIQSSLVIGFPDAIDLGTGRSKPGGIESTFEYNGVIMNVRSWLDTFIINQVDGIADPDVRDAREINPGRDGETIFASYYGGRTIVLTGTIRAHTLAKMRDMQMGLKQSFQDINVEKPLYIRGNSIEEYVKINCKKYQPIIMTEIQRDLTYRRDFQITLRASKPFFESYQARQTTRFLSDDAFIIFNYGNYRSTPIIRLIGPLDSATNGSVAARIRAYDSSNTMREMIINSPSGSTTAIRTNEYIEIDTSARTVKYYDSSGNSTYAYNQLDFQSEWLSVEPGRNTIEMIESVAGSSSLSITINDTYI